MVVNNNAAATLLILAALAAGREVVISRGELVEIGGGFRVPDVMAQSGAILREVGTTNRTRIADYTAAAGAGDGAASCACTRRTSASKASPSGRRSLRSSRPAARSAIPVVEDLGSGCLDDATRRTSRRCGASIAAGVDLVCFSGDKLLGGPQAGIIAGRTALVDRLRTHPLMRALRVDKITFAALEATLVEYLAGRADRTVPVQRMLALAPRRSRRAPGRSPSASSPAAGARASSAAGRRSAAAARRAWRCRRCCWRSNATA